MTGTDDCVDDALTLRVGADFDFARIERNASLIVAAGAGVGHALPDHQAGEIGMRLEVIKRATGERSNIRQAPDLQRHRLSDFLHLLAHDRGEKLISIAEVGVNPLLINPARDAMRSMFVPNFPCAANSAIAASRDRRFVRSAS